MESLSTTQQRTGATTVSSSSSRAYAHTNDVAVIAAQVEGARQSMAKSRKSEGIQTHGQGPQVAEPTDDADGATEDGGS